MSTQSAASEPHWDPATRVRATGFLAWFLCVVALTFLALSVLLGYFGRSTQLPEWHAWPVPAIFDAGVAGAPVLGALIASRRPRSPYGWAWLVYGVGAAAASFGGSYATYAAAVDPGSLPAPGTVATVLAEAWVVSIILWPFLLLLFPDGRLPSRRWRLLAWLVAAAGAVLLILGPLGPGGSGFAPVENPFGVGGAAGEAMDALVEGGTIVIFGAVALSALSLVSRYRGAGSVERQQIKWFACAAALLGLHVVAELTGLTASLSYAASNLLFALNLYALYAAVAIAILRHHLYDVDLLINRALVYGALTACVVAVYVVVVGYLGMVLQTRDTLLVSLLATGLVAVVFQPLRHRLQRAVNRLTYGERDDPYTVLSRLGRRLEGTLDPEAALAAVAEAVVGALKAPHAAVELGRDGTFREAAEHGSPKGEPTVLALLHHGEEVGRLRVSPRAPGEAFSRQDLRLLEDLARQAGAAAHAVRLTAELRSSREKLVTAREEERRRLRRDLHDGVGPQLAALNLELETASELVANNPEASAFLEKLSERAREAVSDVRRSVHGLRPPSLDELGLIPALKETAARLSQGGLKVSVDASEGLPHLPAAAEVACYRIAQEAMTNACRHARATLCRVRLRVDGTALDLSIEDDGAGVGGARAGVGMSAMRERAEELDGTLSVGPSVSGGTLVRAVLPLHNDPPAGRDSREGE